MKKVSKKQIKNIAFEYHTDICKDIYKQEYQIKNNLKFLTNRRYKLNKLKRVLSRLIFFHINELFNNFINTRKPEKNMIRILTN